MSEDKKDLKTRALLERISSLTTNYENQIADLRVELTFVSKQLEETLVELNSLREQHADYEKAFKEAPSDDSD